MSGFTNGLATVADMVGLGSAGASLYFWWRTKAHAKEASDTLKIINNYRKVETYTDVSKKLELLKRSIRECSDKPAIVQREYKELEIITEQVISVLPSKNRDLIDQMRIVESALRVSGDKREKLEGNAQYDILNSIEVVASGLKVIREELLQDN